MERICGEASVLLHCQWNPKKCAVLLSNCGPSTFRLLRSIVLPAPLTNFSFSDSVSQMKAHREPRSSIIVQRYQFNSRQRSPSEYIAEYVAALRKLAKFCNYGESLNEMLCDRFVCGIAHPAVQKRLLTELDLTFTKAVTVAQAVELAEKGAQQIQSSVDKEVHKFSITNAKPPGAVKNKNDSFSDKSTSIHCYRCGGKHNQQTCRFKSETCHFCNKRGHIAKVCKSKKRQLPPSKPTHQVKQDPPDSVPSEYNLFTVPGQQSKPLMYIFGESKSIPSVASARVQRWALTLSAYTYSIKYRKGEDMCSADALSRLPLTAHPEIVPRPPETIALLEHLANVPLAASQI